MKFLLITALIMMGAVGEDKDLDNLMTRAREESGNWIYQHLLFQAETHGKFEESLKVANQLLERVTPQESDLKQQLVKTRAMIFRSWALTDPDACGVRPNGNRPAYAILNIGLESLQKPDALYFGPDSVLVIAGTYWLEEGVWLNEDYFILELTRKGALLENPAGERMDISWPAMIQSEKNHAIYSMKADGDQLLRFAAVQEGAPLYKTSDLLGVTPGVFEADSWMDLIQQLCDQADLSWRRNENGLYVEGVKKRNVYKGFKIKRISVLDATASDIVAFIADQVEIGWEDPSDLLSKKVDLEVVDEPWDSVLDRLGEMCGLTWEASRDKQGKLVKLIAQPR